MSTVINQLHYVNDRCLGGSLKIGSKNAYTEYNADVYDISYAGGSLDQSYEKKVGKSSFDVYHSEFTTQTLTLSLYVGGIDKNDAFFNVNKLIADARDCEIEYEDEDKYEFASVLTGFEVEFTDIEWFYSVVLTFEAIRRMPKVVAKANLTKKIEFVNFGTVTSGAKITISSDSSIDDLAIGCYDRYGNGQTINITKLTANKSFVIDGINGEVLEDGINEFKKTDMVLFPMVIPGSNEVTASSAVNFEIEYYPTYEI